MIMMRYMVSWFFMFTLIPAANGYKILFLYPFATKSHLITTLPIAEELVKKGHDVRVVSPFNLKMFPSVRQDVMGIDDLRDEVSKDMLNNYDNYYALKDAFLNGMFIEMLGDDVFRAPVVQQLMKEGKQYDLVVANAILGDFTVAISSSLADHCVVMSAGPIPSIIPNPAFKPLSTVPTYMLPWESEMSFWKRLANFAIHVGLKLFMVYDTWPKTDKVVKKYVPEAPPVADSWGRVELFMENADTILVPPRPSVSNIVTFVAPHCHEAKPLPEKFVNIFEKAGNNGVIIFTMGSFIKPKFMALETRDAFLSAFSRLKQTVIWNFEDDAIKVPPNVVVTKWIPQSDLLGHPRTRLLITHGGLLSLQEALYHGVPVIGIPFFADQPGNVARLGELGIGDGLFFDDVTAENVYDKIHKVLSNQSYTKNVEKYSKMFRDQKSIGSNAEVAARWIEYVVRHNDTNHLRERKLHFVQYFLLDVIVFVLLSIVIVFYCSYKILRLFFKMFKSKKSKMS